MKFIKNAIIGIIKWASRNNTNERDCKVENSKSHYGTAIMNKSSDIADGNNGMNFTVYSAIGGKVIQIRSYDPSRDRHVGSLYVITDKEDLGEELSQIITRESLSR